MNPLMGPRYIVKDAYTMKMQEMKYLRHRQKLKYLKSVDLRKEYESDENLARLHQVKVNNLRFQSNEKLNEIDRENQILLERLVLISKKSNPELQTTKVEQKPVHILHLTYRKREQERIAHENEVFAKRLLSQRPLFDRKKLDKEFERHSKLKKQMQKLEKSPQGHDQKLPQLTQGDQKPREFITSMPAENRYPRNPSSITLTPRGLISPSASQSKLGIKLPSPSNQVGLLGNTPRKTSRSQIQESNSWRKPENKEEKVQEDKKQEVKEEKKQEVKEENKQEVKEENKPEIREDKVQEKKQENIADQSKGQPNDVPVDQDKPITIVNEQNDNKPVDTQKKANDQIEDDIPDQTKKIEG